MFTRHARGSSHRTRTPDSRGNSSPRASVAPSSLRHLLARLRRAVGASIRPPLSRKTEMFFARFFCPHFLQKLSTHWFFCLVRSSLTKALNESCGAPRIRSSPVDGYVEKEKNISVLLVRWGFTNVAQMLYSMTISAGNITY